MTYAEITFLIIAALILLGSFVLTAIDDSNGPFIPLAVVILLATFGICYAVSSGNNTFEITKEVEFTPVVIKLVDDRLVIVTDEYIKYEFISYKDIMEYKNGGKFYKRYFYKQVFGPDAGYSDVIILKDQ